VPQAGEGDGEWREGWERCAILSTFNPQHSTSPHQRQHGFTDVTVENIRKRSSKKELFEFVVSGKYANVRD
jgi:hypothetical protein